MRTFIHYLSLIPFLLFPTTAQRTNCSELNCYAYNDCRITDPDTGEEFPQVTPQRLYSCSQDTGEFCFCATLESNVQDCSLRACGSWEVNGSSGCQEPDTEWNFCWCSIDGCNSREVDPGSGTILQQDGPIVITWGSRNTPTVGPGDAETTTGQNAGSMANFSLGFHVGVVMFVLME